MSSFEFIQAHQVIKNLNTEFCLHYKSHVLRKRVQYYPCVFSCLGLASIVVDSLSYIDADELVELYGGQRLEAKESLSIVFTLCWSVLLLNYQGRSVIIGAGNYV